MSPINAEPPKANPLAKPASSSSTLKLKPIDRPTVPGAKPGLPTGLKLPQKPGLATSGLKLPSKPGLATGLKLPPKPGMPTQTGLKLPPKPGMPTQTGLKLPSKPGLATAGLRLPTKPTIHKPGAAPTAARPTLPGMKKPTLPGMPRPVAAPAAPVAASTPPPAAPAPSVTELTPLTPTELGPAEPPLEALKSATQNLKSVTAPIPQQAILRKTGILAEEKDDALKQAAKSKTSRISLSEAMGAAPVQNESAPMKTIRIRRPIDIPGATKPDLTPPAAPAPAVAPAAEQPAAAPASSAESAPPGAPAEAPVTMTQRKTLKIARPSGGVVRPSGKFGVKRPGTMMTAKTVKPAVAKPSAAAGADASGAKTDEAGVAEIADLPTPAPVAPVPVANVPGEKPLPKGVSIMGILVQTAACVTMGALAWWLYNDTQILPF